MPTDLGADGHVHRIEAACVPFGQHVFDFVVEDEAYAHAFQPTRLLLHYVAWQAIGRNTKVQHTTSHRASLMDFHLMAEPGEVISSG